MVNKRKRVYTTLVIASGVLILRRCGRFTYRLTCNRTQASRRRSENSRHLSDLNADAVTLAVSREKDGKIAPDSRRMRPFLHGQNFDPETTPLIGVAFESARAAVKRPGDLTDEMIAKKIIELANAGERNVEGLCEACGLGFPIWAVRDSFDGEIRCRGDQ